MSRNRFMVHHHVRHDENFKPGTLVTRMEYEAAASIICQAHANGQMKDWAEPIAYLFQEYVKAFKDPIELRKEVETRLLRLSEYMLELKDASERENSILSQIDSPVEEVARVDFPNGSAIDFSTPVKDTHKSVKMDGGYYDVHVGRITSLTPNLQNLPKPDPKHGREYEADRSKQCNCKYEGYNFHVNACMKKGRT